MYLSVCTRFWSHGIHGRHRAMRKRNLLYKVAQSKLRVVGHGYDGRAKCELDASASL